MTNLEKVLQFAKENHINLYEPTHKSKDKIYQHLYKSKEAYRVSVACIGVTRNNMELYQIHRQFPEVTRVDGSVSHVYDLFINE
jgi:hypothetical protein